MEEKSGDYEIINRLGVGGMAETFVAIRFGPGGYKQHVCLKKVLPAFNDNPDFLRQFESEAKVVGAMNHSNIVSVIDYGSYQGSPYLALELINGPDLKKLLTTSDNKTLSSEIAVLIGIDIAFALDYAHDPPVEGLEGIVHRDISPSNILISDQGYAKLADFGVAKIMTNSAATASHSFKGKIPYMSPEYIQAEDTGPASDLFSLGVVLFEILAGQRPFDGSHDVETMQNILTGNALSLADLKPKLSPSLIQTVHQLIEVDPLKRIQDAETLISLLSAEKPASHHRDALRFLAQHNQREETKGLGPESNPLLDKSLNDNSFETKTLYHLEKDKIKAKSKSQKKQKIKKGNSKKTVSLFLLVAVIVLISTLFYFHQRNKTTEKNTPNFEVIDLHQEETSIPKKHHTKEKKASKPIQQDPQFEPKTNIHSNSLKDEIRKNKIKQDEINLTESQINEVKNEKNNNHNKEEKSKKGVNEKLPKDAQIKISIVPFGRLWLDGKPVKESKWIDVRSGKHKISFGRFKREKSVKVNIKPNAKKHVHLNL